MKKLLIALLMLCLLSCAAAEDMTVHIHDLSADALLTRSVPDVPEDFLRLCPEADADTVRCITPEMYFRLYDLFRWGVYADADGTAWLTHGESITILTDPGSRLTSLYASYLRPGPDGSWCTALLYTQQRGSETDVRCLDLANGEITPLLTTEGTLVLVEPSLHLTYTGYTPLPGYSDLLLCTAQIMQADAADPALTYTLEAVVGDLLWADNAYTASLHSGSPVTIVYGGERTESLAAFADAYREMYPDHTLSDPTASIVDRTYLTGDPAYGRLYEITFNSMTFLWRDGQAHPLTISDETTYSITGLSEAVLTDLNGDGTEELVLVYSSGSGIHSHIAAVYDPVTRTGTRLYAALVNSADDQLHLMLDGGVCLLYTSEGTIGQVTAHGLDTAGLEWTDVLQFFAPLGF